MALIPVWPKPGLNVKRANGIGYYTPGEIADNDNTYVFRRLSQQDLYDYDPTGVPYYPFIDAQSIVQGRVGTDLDTLRGLFDGATTLTTGRNSEGDGNGANFTWDETSVVARNGTTVFGLGATGRWLQTGTVGGGGGASFTGPSISFTANGTLNTTGIADAAFFAVVPTSDNLIARGLTPPSSGSNINVRQAFNNSNYTIIVPHQDGGAAATAQFVTDDGVSKVWPGKTWFTFSHDATLTKYRVRAQDDALVNGLLVTDLATRNGRKNGERVFVKGKAAANDGAPFVPWDFASGVSSGADGRTKINCSNGQWQRDLNAAPMTMAEWGFVFTAGTNNQPACSAMMNAAAAVGGCVVDLLPACSIRTAQSMAEIGATVTVAGAGHSRFRVSGGGYSIIRNAFRFVWTGDTTSPMFRLNAPGLIFENVTFDVGDNKSGLCAVDFGASGASACRFYDCHFQADATQDASHGVWEYHVTSDIANAGIGNCENMEFHNCHFQAAKRFIIRHRGGQPFDWLFQGCNFDQDLYFDYWHALHVSDPGTYPDETVQGGAMWGIAGYGPTFRNCDFRSLATLFYGHFSWTVMGRSSERSKRIYHAPSADGNAVNQVMRDHRFAIDAAAYKGIIADPGGDVTINAAEEYLVNIQERGSFTLQSNAFTGGPRSTLRFNFGAQKAVFSQGNTYHNEDPFSSWPLADGTKVPGTFRQGDFGTAVGPTYNPLPNTEGTRNPGGEFTLTGAGSGGGITTYTWTAASGHQYEQNADYQIVWWVISKVGTPAVGSELLHITTKLSNTFTFTADAAPGGGNSVTFGFARRLKP